MKIKFAKEVLLIGLAAITWSLSAKAVSGDCEKLAIQDTHKYAASIGYPNATIETWGKLKSSPSLPADYAEYGFILDLHDPGVMENGKTGYWVETQTLSNGQCTIASDYSMAAAYVRQRLAESQN